MLMLRHETIVGYVAWLRVPVAHEGGQAPVQQGSEGLMA